MAQAAPPDGWAAADAVHAYLGDLVAAKRADPGDDLLSALTAAVDDGQLDEAELLSNAWLLVIAGHDTTVNLIGNGLVALFRHPAELARLRADLSLVPAAVEEFLRYDGPLQHTTFRMTTEPVTIGGVDIPAHEQVLVVAAAANRDPRPPGPPRRRRRLHLAPAPLPPPAPRRPRRRLPLDLPHHPPRPERPPGLARLSHRLPLL